MGENLRFIKLIDELRDKGLVADYVQIASQLGTNKAAISDIKSGRKKLSIEIVRSLKMSYPDISIDWIIMGNGEPFVKNDTANVPPTAPSIFLDKITEQAEEIGRLKERINQLELERRKNAPDAQPSNIADVG